MAFYTAVNSQITDSITQANTEVLGNAPAVVTGNLFIATSQALSNAAHNATTNQQLAVASQQATSNMGIANIYSVDTASTGKATHEIYG